jgi:hypothetical protein
MEFKEFCLTILEMFDSPVALYCVGNFYYAKVEYDTATVEIKFSEVWSIDYFRESIKLNSTGESLAQAIIKLGINLLENRL